ncbi:uncharacterized protein EAE97_010541 [Botrytis byssoidea]|uniref:Uncharacterized protein n=1 Tax=Botrytis byssoidea TaxID=139641 RepID=A0A9P5LJW8_9HELO|nr:uncharacterized protein EAE97_010541 [Botrytis byssoidea]KAF7925460.1 hypothetical protein EAE97_010541 [Botrytis byssoidea]
MSMLPPKTYRNFTDDEKIIIELWAGYLNMGFREWRDQQDEENDIVKEIFRLVGKGLNTSARISSAYKSIPKGSSNPDFDRIFIVNKARRFFRTHLRDWRNLSTDFVAANEKILIDKIAAECGTRLEISIIGQHYLQYKISGYEDFIVMEWAEHWKTDYDTNREREDGRKHVVSKLRYFFGNATSERAIRSRYMRERPHDEGWYPAQPRKTLEELRQAPSSGPRYPR